MEALGAAATLAPVAVALRPAWPLAAGAASPGPRPVPRFPSLARSGRRDATSPTRVRRQSSPSPPPCSSQRSLKYARPLGRPRVRETSTPVPSRRHSPQCSGTENGKRAKEFREKGQLVPNEIVFNMVKERLLQPDAQEKGWLLDGYPRSYSQAMALETLGIRPDIFILLDVPDEILVERVVGRRLDPVTGKIYHLKYSPPENEEIASRLTQRFDDTKEKVKLRLQTHYQNVKSLLSIYEDVIVKIKGDTTVEDVFAGIDKLLASSLDKKTEMVASA